MYGWLVLMLVLGSCLLGGVATWVVMRAIRGNSPGVVRTQLIAEKVRAVGKLVGLEVYAKEIATARKGLSWMPPVLLSQARIAMIFQFEKQYAADLGAVSPDAVERLAPGRYRLRLPAVRGSLRLIDVQPYDIQQGKLLGLLDVVPMTAERQGELMKQAQIQASELYAVNDDKYRVQAREAIERHLRALLSLLDVELEIQWQPDAQREEVPARLTTGEIEAKSPAAAAV